MSHRRRAQALGGLAIAVCVSAPALAHAATTSATEPIAADGTMPRPKPYIAVEAQGLAVTQLLPHGYFGGDAAVALGREGFMVRIGAQAVGGRPFAFAQGRIGNALGVFTLDGCGAKTVYKHRVRMCVGGQAGAMTHRWIGFDRPGRSATPYVAGTLRGDYHVAVSRRIGVLLGVGVSVPVIGPEFHGRDAAGVEVPIQFPGPVTGMLTLGMTFRLR
ncbi:MAG: hypothetical protein K1X88_19760 [Nannocystaceae bacterium]|nr:hypothetical protein [Nannocystaceae bacterium]